MAVWHLQGLLWRRSPGVPSGVMFCLRVLARTGRADCMRPHADFPPSSDHTALSIFASRVGEARAVWPSGCEFKSVGTRKSPSYLARKLATAVLQSEAAMVMRIRIIQRFTRSQFAPTPAAWGVSSSYRPIRAMAVRKWSKCCQLFRAFRERALFVRG
jgi:hypothetical protein